MKKSLLVFAFAALVCTLNTVSAVGVDPESLTLGAGGTGGALLGAALPVLLGFIGLALCGALTFGAKYLRQKAALVQNKRVAEALALTAELACDKVRQLIQESTRLLKEASADGTLTQAEAQAACTTAVKEVWASLPADLRRLLARLAGGESAAIDTYVRPKVEAAVAQNRGGKRYPGSNVPRIELPEIKHARERIGLGLPAQYDSGIR